MEKRQKMENQKVGYTTKDWMLRFVKGMFIGSGFILPGVSGMVLRDREILSTDGAIIIGIVVNHRTKEVIGGPDVQSRGVIYLKDADHIVKEIGSIMERTIEEAVREKRYENASARMEAKERIVKYVLKETGKRPMILPAIVEINVTE